MGKTIPIKDKEFKLVAVWSPVEGGLVKARIETPTGKTKWICKSCRNVKYAEAVAENLFNALKENFI